MSRRAWLAPLFVALLAIVSPAAALGATLREGLDEFVRDLVAGLPTGRELSVAVTEFPDLQGATSDLSRYVAERLTTSLSQRLGLVVVDRRRLAQVLTELGWSQSEMLDPAKAPRLSQAAGVDAVLVGSLADLGTALEVEGRVVALGTGQVFAVAAVTVPKDPSVTTLLARGRQVPSWPGAPPGLPSHVTGMSPPGLTDGAPLMRLFARVGARWRYATRFEHEQGFLFKRKVTQTGHWTLASDGEVPFGTGTAFRVRGEHRLGPRPRGESFYYRVSDGAIEQIGDEHEFTGGQKILVTYAPSLLLWRADAKPGDRWETAFKSTQRATARPATLLRELSDGVLAAMSTSAATLKVVVGALERVSVPLGDFDARRVEYHRGAVVIVDWYAPALGIVRRTMTSPKGRLEADLVEVTP